MSGTSKEAGRGLPLAMSSDGGGIGMQLVASGGTGSANCRRRRQRCLPSQPFMKLENRMNVLVTGGAGMIGMSLRKP